MNKKKDDGQLYIKVNGRYSPVGFNIREQMRDGIWLVQSDNDVYSKISMTWLSKMYGMHKIGDVPSVDLPYIAGLEKYIPEIADVLSKSGHLSYMDMARKVLGFIARKAEEQKSNLQTKGRSDDTK